MAYLNIGFEFLQTFSSIEVELGFFEIFGLSTVMTEEDQSFAIEQIELDNLLQNSDFVLAETSGHSDSSLEFEQVLVRPIIHLS